MQILSFSKIIPIVKSTPYVSQWLQEKSLGVKSGAVCLLLTEKMALAVCLGGISFQDPK